MARLLRSAFPIALPFLAALIVTTIAVIGARDLEVDADVVSALSGDAPEFLSYARFQERFDLGRADEAVLIRAEDLADPVAFAALEDLILELQFTEGVAEVVSLFTIPAPGSTTPLILSEDAGADLAARFAALRDASPAASALVTQARDAALLQVIATEGAAPGQIAQALDGLDPAPLSIRTVGQQAVERQISQALIRDQAVVTPLAVLICVLVGALILRSAIAILVAAVPAVSGVIWFTGILGWSGQPLDPWLASLPTLVMVLAFADSLHLFYATREDGGSLRRAMAEVLPAAFLTSLTSALALASFAVVGTDALMGLAIWGPVAVFCGFASVALLFPLMARLLAGRISAHPGGFARVLAPLRRSLGHPRRVLMICALSVLVLLPALNRAEPSFSLSEHIRDTSPLGRDLAFMDAAGLGSASLFIEIDTPPEGPGSQAEAARLAAAAEVVFDLGGGDDGTAPALPERFRARDDASVALPVLLPLSPEPAAFGAALTQLEEGLSQAGLADVTALEGQSLLAHEVVPETVGAMRLSFYIALAAIALVVALSQRSITLALLATGISALPMLAIEGWLVLSGSGMTMAVAFALTVAFGIAVDDTIHFLNRWRRAEGTPEARVTAALEQAGPPMIASTLLMTLGFAATALSATASLPAFGGFVALALWMALIADLIFLPALIRLVTR